MLILYEDLNSQNLCTIYVCIFLKLTQHARKGNSNALNVPLTGWTMMVRSGILNKFLRNITDPAQI